LRIVHISAADYGSGASRATFRLHRKLLDHGVDSLMVVGFKLTDDPTVIGSGSTFNKIKFFSRKIIDGIPQKFYPNRKSLPWSNLFLPDTIIHRALKLKPDLINLHWISNGVLGLKSLSRFKIPLAWVLHDSWPFTGGCHLIGDCIGYRKSCGMCPQLNSNRQYDLSRLNHYRKMHSYENLNLTLVAPSNWVAECAGSASVLEGKNIEVIPHGLDTKKFEPLSKEKARKNLGLDPAAKIILFGSAYATTDMNKGFDLFQAAVIQFRKEKAGARPRAIVFGADLSLDLPDLGIETDFHGYIRDDEKLNQLYSAADVMVVPSRQETFGQTALEALACGTPVVAFDCTGPKDIIDHRETGYLATPYDPDDLFRGIKWAIEDNERNRRLSENARTAVLEKFTVEKMATNYIDLYRKILAK
jgi:glycosyltransferase involved in cell wall biosynthesis